MWWSIPLLWLAFGQESQPEPERKDSITVDEKVAESGQSAGAPVPLTAEQAKSLPSQPSDVREALPLIPGVVRTPEGKLVISSGPEHRSTLLVNSTDVTDPATGGFGATVPIDIVGEMNVYQSPFLVEYGRFTAGVVDVETKHGGDKWHGELNDPTPELRIRSWHLVGIRAFTPRLSGSGPLIKNKLYVSGAFEYRLNKVPVFTLPFPYNESKTEQWNTFAQFDYVASARHLMTFTVHLVPQKTDFVNPDFYNPQPTTPSWHAQEYRGTAADTVSFERGTLSSLLSVAEVSEKTGAQGGQPFVMLPNTNSGNYYFRQQRTAGRFQWGETFSTRALSFWGTHHLKFGGLWTRTEPDGDYAANPIEIRNLAGDLLQQISFVNGPPFTLRDWEASGFFQDTWTLRPQFTADIGLRSDYQDITGVQRFAPRAGFAWSPFGDSATTIRAGYGWFFDRVPLSVLAFPYFPTRGVPNVLGIADYSDNALVYGARRPGNFSPESTNWSLQIDHRFANVVVVRARYIQSHAQGLMTIRPTPVAYVLGGNGLARSQQFEVMTKVAWKRGGQLLFSYVHSDAIAHINDFSEYLGDFAAPLIRQDYLAEPAGNIPNRFLAWGVLPLQHGFQIAPVLEWRTGFPYSAVNAAQNYVGPPNSLRYPEFFSADLRVSKDIQFKNHAFRVSVSGFNLTNHWNPEAVRWNTADPLFGQTLGQRPRRFRADFDFLF